MKAKKVLHRITHAHRSKIEVFACRAADLSECISTYMATELEGGIDISYTIIGGIKEKITSPVVCFGSDLYPKKKHSWYFTI